MDGHGDPVALAVNARRFLRVVGYAAITVVLLNVVFHIVRYGMGYDGIGVLDQFDLDSERNLATYFSAAVLLTLAGLLVAIGRIEHRRGSRDAGYWFLLAAALLYVSIDEATGLHGGVTGPLRETFGLSGVFYFAWVIPATIDLAVFGIVCIRFFLRLDTRTRRLFTLSALLYVGGALGMELVGGYYFDAHGGENPVYSAIVTVEETLEIAGMLVFLYALLDRVRRLNSEVSDAGHPDADSSGASFGAGRTSLPSEAP